ncbi:MAG: S53 family peptidase [Candidatus Dormibacteria bacterium]
MTEPGDASRGQASKAPEGNRTARLGSGDEVDRGALDPDERLELTLVLRPRPDQAHPDPGALGALSPRLRAHLTREQLARVRGADPADLDRVRSWALSQGLEVGGIAMERRSLRLRGTVGQLNQALGMDLRRRASAALEFRAPLEPPAVPAALSEAVVAVLGADTTPRAQPQFRRLPLPPTARSLAEAAPLSYLPPQVGELYRYPQETSGAGHCIGLIELGGGYRESDLHPYFAQLGVAEPELVPISVDGAANQPTGSPDGPDGEVTLDIEVAGALAPGVRLALYFAPNTDQGFLDAIQAALHDAGNRPSVISISWGGPEAGWPQATMSAFDQAFQDAALLGVTVCVAAGDRGSGDGVDDGLAHCDFPASSPHVLACGGTRLTSAAGQIKSEVTWNDGPGQGATGGGVSAVFPLPAWQQAAAVPPSVDPGHDRGRGIPDVAGDADPETGYQVLVDGTPAVFGGTSAAAPLWAALLVRCAQGLGQEFGYLNPLLYQRLAARSVTHDITQGNNGAYSAQVGWDACTGWGSPDGAALLEALRS